jgi:hypothetical protein
MLQANEVGTAAAWAAVVISLFNSIWVIRADRVMRRRQRNEFAYSVVVESSRGSIEVFNFGNLPILEVRILTRSGKSTGLRASHIPPAQSRVFTLQNDSNLRPAELRYGDAQGVTWKRPIYSTSVAPKRIRPFAERIRHWSELVRFRSKAES